MILHTQELLSVDETTVVPIFSTQRLVQQIDNQMILVIANVMIVSVVLDHIMRNGTTSAEQVHEGVARRNAVADEVYDFRFGTHVG
jgi:ABC-type enterochelin transport system ATPase subunit